MEYRNLGATGLKVAPLCLGTMMFGDRTDKPTSERIAGMARDAGINFIDTADAYSKGESERITGAAIRRDRDWWVLATKCANPVGDGPNGGGLGRKWVLQAVENSLRRLSTDYIDVLYLHKEDLATPIAETVGVLGELIRDGKIRYFGLSNYRSWRHAEYVRQCDLMGVPRPAASQPLYNAMNRMVETEVLPVCAHYGIGVVPYSPVARGVLTGKYQPGAQPDQGSRAGRQDRRMMQTEFRDESLEAAQRFKAHAETKGCSSAQFACAWVLNNAFIDSCIVGPRTEEQMRDYLGVIDVTVTQDDEDFVDTLVTPGHPSTPGYNDPQYPPEGRRPRPDTSARGLRPLIPV